MNQPAITTAMLEQDRQISEVIAKERSRLRNFIRWCKKSSSSWSKPIAC
jgi:hypothetical protein